MTSAILTIGDFVTRRQRLPFVARLVRHIEPAPGRRILDLGGGTGAAADLYADGAFVTVLEPSRKKVLHGRQRRTGLRFVEGVAEDIPFPDGSYDCVVSIAAFHHYRDQGHVLREAHRVLADHGRLVLADVHPSSGNGRLNRFFENDVMGYDCTFTGPERASGLAADAGFQDIAVESLWSAFLLTATR